MSHPRPPVPAKLIIGMITREKELAIDVGNRLWAAFGDIDMISRWFVFDDTDYYEAEMGKRLYRRMLAFKHLVEQGSLGGIKINTNIIENEFASDGKRRVNIDPGLLTHERFVLATGKNFTHRIYIGDHIYADLTLIYQQGQFHPLPWTYPDYRKENIQQYLFRVRQKYSLDLKIAKC